MGRYRGPIIAILMVMYGGPYISILLGMYRHPYIAIAMDRKRGIAGRPLCSHCNEQV
jgi:hypothetical protein